MSQHVFNRKRRQFITQSAGIVGAASSVLSPVALATGQKNKTLENLPVKKA